VEWLESDGLGGFASGTDDLVRTRRYHALLISAATPPTNRFALVNDLEVWIEGPAGPIWLSSHRYAPDVTHPDGRRRLERFDAEPWPRWTFGLESGGRVEQELFVTAGAPRVALRWRLSGTRKPARLFVRPLLSGRDLHALHHRNDAFRFEPEAAGETLIWRPYPGVPPIVVASNGAYAHEPSWYLNFQYDEERARGLDFVEDLASPGVFSWDLARGEATLIFAAGETPPFKSLHAAESRRRRKFPSAFHRAADAYLVRRGEGLSVVAGYPWFADWGRDTLIALRGLCLATGRTTEAGRVLATWARALDGGMIPNRFPEGGGEPEFNSVDASLWFIVTAREYLAAAKRVSRADRRLLNDAEEAILESYARGARYGIRCDEDGLLRAGAPGVALTWMDVKVGEVVLDPRPGKPVEIQALWLNALAAAAERSARWRRLFERGLSSFRAKFWNDAAGCCYDGIDEDRVDATLRPNQILAVGGLPRMLLEGERARRVVDEVEEQLWTPAGLRSLAPGEPGYRSRYAGGPVERDEAYHHGAVWPWLAGPFVEAWVRVRGGGESVRREARRRFFEPLAARAVGGHLSEIADGDPPHAPRGCPFQAWSVGEALRLDALLGR
jgi:predicted glycogen debranching enzyme